MATRWRPDEDERLRRMYVDGAPLAAIAGQTGRTGDAVNSRRVALGLQPRRTADWSALADAVLREAVRAGLNATVIAEKMHRPVEQVRVRRRALGLGGAAARRYNPSSMTRSARLSAPPHHPSPVNGGLHARRTRPAGARAPPARRSRPVRPRASARAHRRRTTSRRGTQTVTPWSDSAAFLDANCSPPPMVNASSPHDNRGMTKLTNRTIEQRASRQSAVFAWELIYLIVMATIFNATALAAVAVTSSLATPAQALVSVSVLAVLVAAFSAVVRGLRFFGSGRIDAHPDAPHFPGGTRRRIAQPVNARHDSHSERLPATR